MSLTPVAGNRRCFTSGLSEHETSRWPMQEGLHVSSVNGV
jgi:hypothetical protein